MPATDTVNPPTPSLAEQVMSNPLIMAIGIGVIGGVIAAVRGKQISQRALYVTSVVTAIGETVLVLDEPEETRPELAKYAGLSAIGILIGMSPFVSWRSGDSEGWFGDKSWIQKLGEGIADMASPEPETDLVST